VRGEQSAANSQRRGMMHRDRVPSNISMGRQDDRWRTEEV
jgi:hypothetical protein